MARQLDDVLLHEMSDDRLEHWRKLSLLGRGAMCQLRRLARSVYMIQGDIIEVGVYRGGSLGMLAETLPHKTVWGCDTFTGIPHKSSIDHNEVGRFACDMERVRQNVPCDNVRLVQGVFPASAPNITRVALAHLDCDQYQSYRESLEWLVSRMADGGLIVSDDYPHSSCKGARKAIDEWLPDGVTLMATRTQAWVRWQRDNTHRLRRQSECIA